MQLSHICDDVRFKHHRNIRNALGDDIERFLEQRETAGLRIAQKIERAKESEDEGYEEWLIETGLLARELVEIARRRTIKPSLPGWQAMRRGHPETRNTKFDRRLPNERLIMKGQARRHVAWQNDILSILLQLRERNHAFGEPVKGTIGQEGPLRRNMEQKLERPAFECSEMHMDDARRKRPRRHADQPDKAAQLAFDPSDRSLPATSDLNDTSVLTQGVVQHDVALDRLQRLERGYDECDPLAGVPRPQLHDERRRGIGADEFILEKNVKHEASLLPHPRNHAHVRRQPGVAEKLLERIAGRLVGVARQES